MPRRISLNVSDGRVFEPPCEVCKNPTSRIEIVPANALPCNFNSWDIDSQRIHLEGRRLSRPVLLYSGVVAGNGLVGNEKSIEEFTKLVTVLSQPVDLEYIKREFCDGAGFCEKCGSFYCFKHWRVSTSGYGHCPKGHGKSLNPHWSPE